MTGPAVGGGISKAHALYATGIIGGELLTLDGHGQFRVAVLLAQALRAHAQFQAEAFALGGQVHGRAQGVGRAEFQGYATGVLVSNVAGLIHLHGRGQRGTERDGIEAVLIADKVGIGEGIQVIDTGVGAEGPGRLVFQAAGRTPVFRLVLDGEMPPVNSGDAAAGNGAGETAGIGDQIGFAVTLARLMHGLAGDLARSLELRLTHVARGHGPHLIDDIHHGLGAEFGETVAGHGVFLQRLLDVVHHLDEPGRVLDIAHSTSAAHGNRLEVLGRHHRADAGTSRRTVQIIDNRGIQAALFRRPAYRGNAQQRVLVFLVQPLIDRPHGLAPDLVGGHQFRYFIFHVQIHRLG